MNLLLVDDSPTARSVLKRALQGRWPEAEFTEAADGLEALQWAALTQPDLILLDLVMPRLDGFGFLEAFRQSPSGAAIPVLVISAFLSDEALARLQADTHVVCLRKPFAPSEVLSAVKNMLPAYINGDPAL